MDSVPASSVADPVLTKCICWQSRFVKRNGNAFGTRRRYGPSTRCNIPIGPSSSRLNLAVQRAKFTVAKPPGGPQLRALRPPRCTGTGYFIALLARAKACPTRDAPASAHGHGPGSALRCSSAR